MTESIDEYYTLNHRRLLRFSKIGSILAWVVLVVYIMDVVIRSVNIIQSISMQQDFQPTLFMIQEDLEILNFFVSLLRLLFQGVFYWFMLKGISLGLCMIVETDLNYRERFQGEKNE